MDFKTKAIELQKKPMFSFGWTPDHENIGIYYQRAANVFANTDLTQAIECYNLATDHLTTAGILFEAAKSQELLGKLLKRSSKSTEAITAFEKAGDLFSRLTQFDTASDMYTNAAQLAESNVPLATRLYTKSVDILVSNDKALLANDTFKRATTYLLKNSLYNESIAMYKQQISALQSNKKSNFAKYQLSIVIIHLSQHDTQSAKDYINQVVYASGNSSASIALLGPTTLDLPPELLVAQQLVQLFESNDFKAITDLVKDQLLFLDVQVGKLATQLSKPAYEIDDSQGFA